MRLSTAGEAATGDFFGARFLLPGGADAAFFVGFLTAAAVFLDLLDAVIWTGNAQCYQALNFGHLKGVKVERRRRGVGGARGWQTKH